MRIFCVAVLFVVGVGATAWAGKPTVAILGLEVIDDGTGLDPKSTRFAKELTEDLRQRPKAGTGPFVLAPGTDKDLLELKLLTKCENEAKDCMLAIAKDLGAAWLIYGKVEKRSTGYQISLKLLNVGTKAFDRSISDILLYADSTGAARAAAAKRYFAKLTGATGQGTLVVKADVARGTIFLDGEAKGNLVNGAVQLAGLAEGRYSLRVEAEGRKPYETKITIAAGEATAIAVTFEPARKR